jgi:hypothetical protein
MRSLHLASPRAGRPSGTTSTKNGVSCIETPQLGPSASLVQLTPCPTRPRFYVNLHTKESTWEKPTEPAPGGDSAPGGPPPGYTPGNNASNPSDTKRPLESNNPYNSPTSAHQSETDEQMARRLQTEESNRGQSDSYYNSSTPQPAGIQGGYPGAPDSSSSQLPPRPDSSGKPRGFLGKVFGKSSSSSHQQYPQQARPGAGYPQQPQGYNQGGYGQGYPQQYGGGPGYVSLSTGSPGLPQPRRRRR